MIRVPFDIDSTRIDINDERQVRWWCGKLGCGDVRLRNAIRNVGQAPHQVDRWLRADRMARYEQRYR